VVTARVRGRASPVTGRLDVLGVLRAICTVVGAVALYCAVAAALWYGLMRAGRRRGRTHARRRAAARAVPVVPGLLRAGREGPAEPWPELPSWLAHDRSWAVAVVLLGTPSVRERTAPFVDFPHREIDWTSLLEESRAWPADQRQLVRSAYEFCRQIRRGRLEPENGITTLS
jgi:hypothetical protein